MKKRIWDSLFLLLLVAFVFAKLPTLNTPFFHDEITLVDMAPNIAVGDLNFANTTPYAGHPPLIGLLLSIPSLLLPLSRVVPHMIALVFALAALAFTYLITKRIAKEPFPFLIALLFASTPLFFTQAGILNLDMPATALILAAFYFYLKPHMVFFVFFSSLAVLAKEPAVLIILVIVSFDYITKGRAQPIKFFINNYFFSIPFLMLASWWLFCKINFGWFIWPEVWDFFNGGSGFVSVLKFIFIECFGLIIFFFVPANKLTRYEKQLTALIAVIVIIPSLFFAAILLKRYLLIVVPFIYLLIALFLSKRRFSYLLIIVAIGFLAVQIYPCAKSVENFSGADMDYLDIIYLHKRGINLLDEKYPNATILAPWPYYFQCSIPYYGYSGKVRNVVLLDSELTKSPENLPQIAYISYSPSAISPREKKSLEFISINYKKINSVSGFGNVVEIYEKDI